MEETKGVQWAVTAAEGMGHLAGSRGQCLTQTGEQGDPGAWPRPCGGPDQRRGFVNTQTVVAIVKRFRKTGKPKDDFSISC